jgi:uncharacterized protein YdbL (DUF1318 family)
MKTFLLALLVLVASSPALALDLHGARATGLIGEKADGYVSALSPSPEVNQLVTDVNLKRRMEYERISKENGQTVSVVGTLAAPKIAGGLPKGAKYQAADGSWKTK